MKLTHATKTLLAGLTLVSTLSLTACNGDTASASPTPTGSASSAPKTDSGGTDQASTGAGTGSNTGKPIGICRSDELEISAVDNTIDTSEGVVTVQFKNGGGRDCTINGFAGVDLKTAAGDTLSVARNGDKPVRAVITDGESAAFNITFPVNNSGGSGVRVAKILVTPPNETKTVTLDWPAGSLPVENPDSPNRPLQISPLGKVG